MRRSSPFGVLDEPVALSPVHGKEEQFSSYSSSKRPSSANAAIRRSTAPMAVGGERERERDRPVTANLSRQRAPFQQQAPLDTSFAEMDSIHMLNDTLPADSEDPQHGTDEVKIPFAQKRASKTKKKTGKSRPSSAQAVPSSSSRNALRTINKVQLSEAEWAKIFDKYRIAGVEDLKFEFLKRGKGSSTRFDYIGKQQLDKSRASLTALQSPLRPQPLSTQPAALTNTFSSTNDMGEDDPPRRETAPLRLSLSSQDPHEGRFLKEFRKKRQIEDQEFAALLERELAAETQHLQNCIDECNQLCAFLDKTTRYAFRDSRIVRKLLDIPPGVDWQAMALSLSKRAAQSGLVEQSTQTMRLIPVDKFHDEHHALLREFKTFSKHNPLRSLDQHVAPVESPHFIGVQDLLQSAKQLENRNNNIERETMSSSKTASRPPPREPDPQPAVAPSHNELRNRNEIIAAQQRILQESDDLEELMISQLREIHLKGWNHNYSALFLSPS